MISFIFKYSEKNYPLEIVLMDSEKNKRSHIRAIIFSSIMTDSFCKFSHSKKLTLTL